MNGAHESLKIKIRN